MKAIKVYLNDEVVATVGYEQLTEFNAGVFCLDGESNLLIQGSKLSQTVRDDFVWHDEPLSGVSSVLVEIVDSESSDEPVTVASQKLNKEQKCSFCFLPESEVGKLFVGKYRPASICVSCVEIASQSQEDE